MKLNIRASQFLNDQKIRFETLVHPPLYSASKLARHLHVAGRQVAKSVLLVGPAGYYLAIVPATHQVDLDAVAQVVGLPVRLAEEQEMAEIFPDCEWGTLTPFGKLYGLSTLMDESFLPSSPLVFEVQRHSVAIRMRFQDYEKLEQPRRFHFARNLQPKVAIREVSNGNPEHKVPGR